MTLLTTDKMQQVQSIIHGTHQTPATMESETFSIRCPGCQERAWGFDETPETGIGYCPYCGGTFHIRDFKVKRFTPLPS